MSTIDPTAPKRVTVDSRTVESHSLADQIELDKYNEAKAAATRRRAGIVRQKMISPGARGE